MAYYGSKLAVYLEDLVGLPVDQVCFILTELIGLSGAVFLRLYLKPKPENDTKRYLFNGLLGLVLAYFIYGVQIVHLLLQGILSYILLLTVPTHSVHIAVFISSMGYLSCLHVHRVFFGHGYSSVDVIGTLMVTTQKLTSLGFAYYDGQKREEKLTPDQKEQAIKKFPSSLQFWSYLFNFQSIIVGPLCFYTDYTDFITGNNVLKHQKPGEKVRSDDGEIIQPDNKIPIAKKFVVLLILVILNYKLTPVFLLRTNWNEDIASRSFVFKTLFIMMGVFTARVRYYLAWTLADIIANASGFGFNGYDENGKAKWDLMTNIDILGLECATSMKVAIDSWNIGTHIWLKRICYTRLPYMNTLGVFILSAFWHGFYPGYYFMFLHWAFVIYAGRGIRRRIRPLFQANSFLKAIYAALTWFGTAVIVGYSSAPYEIIEFWPCWLFYNSFNWSFTIVLVVITIVLPCGSSKKDFNNVDKKNEKKE